MSSIVIQGDTSGSITVEAPSVAGTHTLTLPKATGNIATDATVGLGTKNLIINGDMRIAQRGTSATGLGNNDTGYHTVDRWQIWENGSPTYEFTQTQDTDVPTGQGFANSLKMACTTADATLSADDAFAFRYKIEGQMLQHLKYGTSNAEQITMSFWVKSNKTGTYIVNPWASSEISKAYTIDSADTWEKKTITFDANTIDTISNNNSTGLTIYMYMLVGTDRTSGTLNTTWSALTTANRAVGQVNLADSTSNYINITGVQLEIGENATPFENRMYSQELAMCQRYYQTISKMAGYSGPTTSGIQCSVAYPIPMRATPTMSQSSVFRFDDAAAGFTQSSTGLILGSTNNTGTLINITNITVNGTFRPHGKANTATLNLDAEL
jgi:hypothetical protein